MLDLFSQAWSTEGLTWLICAAIVAGLVRGFAGFGTALIFMPVVGQWVSPVWALIILVVMDIFGPLPNVPRALRDGHLRDVVRLTAGLVVMVPVGIFVLSILSPEPFRYIVSLTTLALLAMLLAGLRYSGPMGSPLLYATGGIGGFLAGSVGLAGPPVIMLYMASDRPASAIRANLLLYLVFSDVIMLVVFAVTGLLEAVPIIIAFLLVPPYLLANVVGAAMFRPRFERLYRWVAYSIICAVAVSGLPIWD